jgi:hypothetical protein
MKRILLAAFLFCACKSNEGQYCERANQLRLYDPQRPGLCEEEYKRLTLKQRECLDECSAKSSVIDCANSCDTIPDEQRTFVKVPMPRPRASAPPPASVAPSGSN